MKYEQAQRAIVDLIAQGDLKAGGRLPTQGDLASYCGVSNITIRRALSELGEIGIIERIQGKGTFVKQSPTSGETIGTVAFMAIGRDPFRYDAMLGSAQRALGDRGYTARFVAATSPCNSTAAELQGVSGALISGTIDDGWVRLLRALAIPFVILGNSQTSAAVWRVDYDWENGARELTRLLHERGCRRIGLVNGGRHYQSGVRLQLGYRDALDELQLPSEEAWTAWCSRGDYATSLEAFFQAFPDTFDGLIVEQGVFASVLAHLYRRSDVSLPTLGLINAVPIYEGEVDGIVRLHFEEEISQRGVELLFKAMSSPDCAPLLDLLQPITAHGVPPR